jgi:hypothetical protein
LENIFDDMGWIINIKLSSLPILNSEGIDATLLHRDINARLGIPSTTGEKIETKTAIEVFNSVTSAEKYIEDSKAGGFMTWRQGYVWKRIGHCLVFLYGPMAPMIPAVPLKCIIRTGESVWKLYSFM